MTLFHRAIAAAAVLAVILMSGPVFAQQGVSDVGFKPPSPSGSFLAARGASVDRRHALAAQYYLDALDEDWDNPLLVDRAFISLVAAGDFSRAAPTARRLLDGDPSHELARLVLGTIAIRERRYGAAIDRLEGMSDTTLLGITGTVLRAWAMVGEDRVEEALDLVGGIQQEGFEEFLVFHRGLMADVAGSGGEGLALLATAYDADPGVFRIVEAYARALANNGDFDRAKQVLDAFYARGVTHPLIDVVAEKVLAGVRPGKFAENVQQGAAELMLGLGTALGGDDASDLGIVFLRMGLHLDPGDDIVAVTLAEMYERAGRYELANQTYAGIAVDSPLRISAIVSTALNQEELGDRAEAINSLRNIANLHQDSIEVFNALADLLRADSQFEEAATQYSRVIELTGGDRTSDWRFFYLRGICYERLKRWPLAEADFRRALELFPEQPQVLNYLGYSLVDQGLKLHEALEMIQKAVELRPTDGYIVDSLGWAFYRLSRYDEAVEALERALELTPTDPTINDHLGDALWQTGRHLEARFQWTIARDLGPDEPGLAERIDRKLAVGLDVVLQEEGDETRQAAADEAESTSSPTVEQPAIEPAPEEVLPEAPPPGETQPVDENEFIGEASQVHQVRPGDSLWSIASEYYGDPTRYEEILDANRDLIVNASRLRPGMELVIPGAN